MRILAAHKIMLYCPKCQQTYDEGSQRFCSNDGNRLVPVSNSEKSAGKPERVFTNLLSRNLSNPERDEKLASIPRFVRVESEEPPIPERASEGFESDLDEVELELDTPTVEEPKESEPAPAFASGEVFDDPEIDLIEPAMESEPLTGSESWIAPRLVPDAPIVEVDFEPEIPKTPQNETSFERPLSRIIRPQDIPSGRAELGDRQINPAGREAFTWENTGAMLGQTVKGRYHIIDRVGEDESGVSYLAEDKIVANKMVVVRVFADEGEADDLTSKIYAEERISFSHVNHPNVVGIIDSGELQEGNAFVITEYVDGHSVKEVLEKTGQFAIARTARVIRQASYALSEMHQNGIIHRNLKPGNIILAHPDGGSEQVKITGFGFSGVKPGEEDLVYKAPEILEGEVATYYSDIFSLAVIAYEMLTGRVPFSGASAKQVLKSQREGMMLNPTNLRLDVPSVADMILEKAMSVNPGERYPKARDFGDAFFNSLTTVSPWDAPRDQTVELIAIEDEETEETPVPPVPQFLAVNDEEPDPVRLEVLKQDPEPEAEPAMAEAMTAAMATEDPAWTKRSPEPPKASKPNWALIGILGAVVIGAVAYAWIALWNKPSEPAYIAPPTANQPDPNASPIANDPNQTNLTAVQSGEVPPSARSIPQPPNTTFFQSTKQNLRGDLARNFVGFTLFYPSDWKVNEAKESTESGSRGKFLDISRNAPNGKLAEQMLISYYESRGTISSDEEKFPQFVAETNETLKKLIPNYQMLSQGKTVINGGWWAYDVKFQGGGTTDTGEKLVVWGRRLFIPAARPGVKNGFEITMLATSYSDEVKSVDDVGNRGGLATVLYTFEPGRF